MSFIPIYNKLTELDNRLKIIEESPPSQPVQPRLPSQFTNILQDTNVVQESVQYSDHDSNTELYKFKADIRNEIHNVKTDITYLTKELTLKSSVKDELVALATKEELAALATKEELVALATKDELAALATKDELVALATKDELVALATKDELVALATKDELVALATKDELAALATKDELVALATKDELVALATKDELAALATKDELVALATKDELVALATKDELAPIDDLLSKFDNIINVIAQLNTKINDICERISALESS